MPSGDRDCDTKLDAIEVPRASVYITRISLEERGVKCPSCGHRDVGRLEIICDLCRCIRPDDPEHIRTIVPRVMDEIEQTRKDAAA